MIPGGPSIRWPRAGDPIPNVKTADRLHGDASQERDRGETSLQIRHAFDRRRRRGHFLDQLSRGGPVRSGHLHEGIDQSHKRSTRHHRWKAPAHSLLQVSHQLEQEELTLSRSHAIVFGHDLTGSNRSKSIRIESILSKTGNRYHAIPWAQKVLQSLFYHRVRSPVTRQN